MLKYCNTDPSHTLHSSFRNTRTGRYARTRDVVQIAHHLPKEEHECSPNRVWRSARHAVPSMVVQATVHNCFATGAH